MQTVKKRTMLQLNLNTGIVNRQFSTSRTLAKYIQAINTLNKQAHVYGVVYLPDDECEEYLAYVGAV